VLFRNCHDANKLGALDAPRAVVYFIRSFRGLLNCVAALYSPEQCENWHSDLS
jgi:hypothetical protein